MSKNSTSSSEKNPADEKRVDIQRIYVKDLSLEMPEALSIFRSEWQPETEVDINVANETLPEDHYEVVLRITAKIKTQGGGIVLEVKQAGIFRIVGFDEGTMKGILEAHCPNVLFPYARETLANLSIRATIPPIHLNAVDFNAVYMQKQQQAQQAQEEIDMSSSSTTKH